MGPVSVMDWIVLIYGALFIIANTVNIVLMFREKEQNNKKLAFTNFSIAVMYALMLIGAVADHEFSVRTHWLEMIIVVAWTVLAVLQVLLPKIRKDK